uniref:Interleukin 17C n=1 Tax=Pundamilia nyererei TaxID=303518 RepID=A0A3B4GWG5_9CICH
FLGHFNVTSQRSSQTSPFDAVVQEDGVAGVDWNAPETLPPWLDILQKVPRHIPISLLILHELCAAASNSTCLSAEKVEARERKFDVNLKKLDLQRDAREHQELTTCEQAAQQMHELNGRALSPWRYYIDRNDSRYPRDIIFAECLCKGCIIDGHEVNDYNSVEVRAPMVVLMKTKCKDADTYRVQKTRIEVPVGCTCVRPKITK